MVATMSSKPSEIARLMSKPRRALVPSFTKYTGTPESEHTRWSFRSAARVLCSISLRVSFETSLVSASSARFRAALVSSGTFFSAASWMSRATERTSS